MPIQGLVFGSIFVLARAAWFAYLNPKDTDLLYYNWFRRRDNWSPTEDLFDKGLFKLSIHLGSRNKCKKVSRMVKSNDGPGQRKGQVGPEFKSEACRQVKIFENI